MFDLKSPTIYGLISPHMIHVHLTSRLSQVNVSPKFSSCKTYRVMVHNLQPSLALNIGSRTWLQSCCVSFSIIQLLNLLNSILRWILMSLTMDPKQLGCHLKLLLLQFVLGIFDFCMPHWFNMFNRMQCAPPIMHSIFQLLPSYFQWSIMLSMERSLRCTFFCAILTWFIPKPKPTLPFWSKKIIFSLIVAIRLDPWTRRWQFIEALYLNMQSL